MFQAFSLKSVEIRRRKARVLCILVALSGGALGAMAQGPLNQGLPANPAFVIRGFKTK